MYDKSKRFRVTTITFDSLEQRERIVDYADAMGITMSRLVRVAVESFMKEHADPRYFQVPLLPDGDAPQDFGVFDHVPTETTASGAHDDFVTSFRTRADAENEVLRLNGMM